MKKYIGTKQIEADPMTMDEADEKNFLLASVCVLCNNQEPHVTGAALKPN